MSGEFDLIRRYAPPGAQRSDVLLGSGDDAALLAVPPGKALVATVDTLVAGRHFPIATSAYDIGWKSLAVNLSDLAAMGAEAAWATVALTMPEQEPARRDRWMAEFTAGIQALAENTGVAIVGGDLTAGPLSITIQALGFVDPQKALRRDTAQVGDLIAVTATLGDAALALRLIQHKKKLADDLLVQLNRPQPRLCVGAALAGRAHAAIDISDGLVSDLGHILKASGVGARIEVAKLPLSPAFVLHCQAQEQQQLALTGGDDYELCVCLTPAQFEGLQGLDVPLTVIGEITEEAGLLLIDEAGRCIDLTGTGYDHFSASGNQ